MPSATTPGFYNGIECRREEKFVPSPLTYSFIYLISIQIIYLGSEFGFDTLWGLDGPGTYMGLPILTDRHVARPCRASTDGVGAAVCYVMTSCMAACMKATSIH